MLQPMVAVALQDADDARAITRAVLRSDGEVWLGLVHLRLAVQRSPAMFLARTSHCQLL
jgi:hypothetical protein